MASCVLQSFILMQGILQDDYQPEENYPVDLVPEVPDNHHINGLLVAQAEPKRQLTINMCTR